MRVPRCMLNIIKSVLNEHEIQSNNVKSAFLAKVGKMNVAVKWRIMDILPK